MSGAERRKVLTANVSALDPGRMFGIGLEAPVEAGPVKGLGSVTSRSRGGWIWLRDIGEFLVALIDRGSVGSGGVPRRDPAAECIQATSCLRTGYF